MFEWLSLGVFSDGRLETALLRLDSTVVKSNIAPPRDSQLLDDGIRVLSRLFAKSHGRTGIKLRLTDYRKPARKLAAAIFYGKKAEKETLYPTLLALAKRVVKQSHRAIEQVTLQCTEALSTLWMDEVKHYRHLLERVIDQTGRRVIEGEAVSASEKLSVCSSPIWISSLKDIGISSTGTRLTWPPIKVF